MSKIEKASKEKAKDKRRADKIYKQLLHYAVYGTMALVLVVTVIMTIQSRPHDSRSRADNPTKTNFQLTAEENNTASDCYTQGDFHSRKWMGNLAPLDTFTIYMPFCEGKPLSNVGLAISIPENPNVSYSVVSPDGSVYYPGNDQLNQTLCLPTSSKTLTSGVWKIVFANWAETEVSTELSVIVAPQNSDWLQSICR